MNISFKIQKQPIISAIVIVQLVNVVSLYLYLFDLPGNKVISVLNYLCMTAATFMMVKAVVQKHIKSSFVQVLFFLWLIYLFISAVPDIINPYQNHIYLKQFLTSILFIYALPILMVADLDLDFWRSLLRLSYLMVVLYLITVVVFNGIRVENCTQLAEGAIILMITWPYHKSRRRLVIISVLIIVIVGMMLEARRNRVVFFGGGLLLAFVVIIISNSSYGIVKKFYLILLMLVFGVGLYYTQSSFSFFFERLSTGMSSREGIIDLFVYDFNTHPSDWFFGRGLYGQFDGGVLNTDDELGLRDGIENGYLYLILKGGGIWLGLLTIIAIQAIYRGLFKSKNLLCKGCAMIILLYYLDMIGFGIPQTTLKYIMVFIAIAGCNTPWLRECSDSFLSRKIGL